MRTLCLVHRRLQNNRVLKTTKESPEREQRHSNNRTIKIGKIMKHQSIIRVLDLSILHNKYVKGPDCVIYDLIYLSLI